MVYCKECIICGKYEPAKGKDGENEVFICPDCKAAIVFVKNHRKDLFNIIVDSHIKKSSR